MKQQFLAFLFLVIGMPLCAQESTPTLLQKLRNSGNDTEKTAVLLELSKHYWENSAKVANRKRLDSASYYNEKARVLAHRLNSSLLIGKYWANESRIAARKYEDDKAEATASKAIANLEKQKDKVALADAYIVRYEAISFKGDTKRNKETLEKARQLYLQGKDQNGAADAMVLEGWERVSEGDFKGAIPILEKALKTKLALKRDDADFIYGVFAYVYNETGDTQKALEYGLKGVAITDRRNIQDQNAMSTYNNTATVYQTLKNGEQSNKYFLKAYNIAKQYDDIATTTILQHNLISAYFQSRDIQLALPIMAELEPNVPQLSPPVLYMAISCLTHSYVMLKQPKRAEKYVAIAIAESKKLPVDHPLQNYLYSSIQDYKFAIGQFEESRQYVLKYQNIARKSGNLKRMEQTYKQLYRVDSAQGKMLSAIENFKMFHKYRDSLYNKKKDQQIAELQVKFDTEKKDHNLLMLKKQSDLQQTKLSQANLTQNISIAGIIILLIAIFMVVRRYRINQRIQREIDAKNNALQQLVNEKEWLVKEVHHRVKNNLQIVMSLLNTQSHFLEDNAAIAAIRNSQHRIHSMSLIHKKLYQSENVVTIDMDLYIRELVEYFKQSFDTGQRIRFITQVDPIELDTTRAVPLGLILNEAIVNSIKHAFPDNREGSISIALCCTDTNEIMLSVHDDGVGISELSADKDFESLGMKLIKGFSGELNADLEFKNENGLLIKLIFDYQNKLIHPKKAS